MYSEQDSFSYPGGLPYDEGQAVPLPPSDAGAAPAKAVDDLDRPLDELIEEERGPRRSNVRGRGMRSDHEIEYVPQPRGEREERGPPMQKMYLLSEVDAVIHHKMASDKLDQEGHPAETVDLDSLPLPPGDDPLVRRNALLFEGQPLTELPTDKVFSYVSSYSTSLPLGVEWINDNCLVVVFPSTVSAASALNSLLADPTSPAVLSDLSMTTPTSTSSMFASELPTAEVHAVPTHLWPAALRPVAPRLRMDADDEGAPDACDAGPMRERLGVRWAREGDKKASRKSKSSSFYQRYGYGAGKPKSTPDQFQEDLLSSSFALDREYGTSSEGRWRHRERSASPPGREQRTLAQRMRRSASPGAAGEDRGGLASRLGDYGVDNGDRRQARGRGMRSDRADLDADLDNLSRGERGEREDRRTGGRARGEGGGKRSEPRPKRDADDLDRELEAFLAQRGD